MKKLLIWVVVFFQIVTVTTWAPVQGDESSDLIGFIKTMKSDERIEELRFPILPEDYEIKSIFVGEDGSYAYQYQMIQNAQARAVEVDSIGFANSDNTDVRTSPFQSCLQANGVKKVAVTVGNTNSISVNQTVSGEIGNTRHVYTVSTKFMDDKQQFNGYPASYIGWQYAKLSGDILTDHRIEVAIGLNDNMIASLLVKAEIKNILTHDSQVVPYLEKQLPCVFTTLGDADLNGTVGAVDALVILKHVVNKSQITDEVALLMADQNNDSFVDVSDALLTLQRVVGKI